jgi:hypothetical protein
MKFFEAVAKAKGEKSALSLLSHVQKGVPAWRKARGKQ